MRKPAAYFMAGNRFSRGALYTLLRNTASGLAGFHATNPSAFRKPQNRTEVGTSRSQGSLNDLRIEEEIVRRRCGIEGLAGKEGDPVAVRTPHPTDVVGGQPPPILRREMEELQEFERRTVPAGMCEPSITVRDPLRRGRVRRSSESGWPIMHAE